MASQQRYILLAAPEVADRLEALRQASSSGDRGAGRILEEAIRTIRRLESGKEDGHHPLTDRTADGWGDLRDCTVSQFRSDPGVRLDCRLVWRQLAARAGNDRAVRELVHVGLRHEVPDAYTQVLRTLEREPTRRVGENESFGNPAYTGDRNQATRTVALEAQRTIALARQGVAPMTKSRPLGEAGLAVRGATRQQVARTLSRDPDGSRH